MTEEEIVKKVCEMMDVKYSHYDNHKMSEDYFPHHKISSIPKIVVYSEKYGMWQFAILEDMSILTHTSNYLDMIISIGETSKSLGGLDGDSLEIYENSKQQKEKYKAIEKWLKENKYNKVINNPNKKINWC